ncbi:MAG: methyltransferase domain-containing protein [Paraglaciecola sp.]|uniref:methyltransferase domain-containing protein n=1 Tax=Paraglaciecola sp. TaxID=1920173 RepID=UPI003298A931
MISLPANYKTRIAKQFSRAAHTYNTAADVQLDIAFDGLNLLPNINGLGLDIGCGTGRISQQLAKKCNKLFAMDLAFGMLEYAQKNNATDDDLARRQFIHWLQGDAEHLPLSNESIDLVFSSMALQWCKDETKVLSEISRVMKPKATAILAIMCAGSFYELNDSWLEIDEQRHTNDFKTADNWREAAAEQGLLVSVNNKQYVTWHQNVRQLLGSIKSIGANVVLSLNSERVAPNKSTHKINKPLSRDTIRNLEVTYKHKYSKNSQLPLTYEVCFLQCIKP